jgi:iron complex outermembrane receptor protein
MSELINKRVPKNFRWQLLTTVSALALGVAGTTDAPASESSHPTVWIELGGQLEQMDAGQELFAPLFTTDNHIPAPETISPLSLEHGPRRSFGGEASLSVMPQGTPWVFSASVRYGRSNSHKTLHQQSYPAAYYKYTRGGAQSTGKALPIAAQFVDAQTKHNESHVILDFQVGKDVGLGLFGRSGSSTLNLGVRFAQFVSHSHITINENPDWHFRPKYVGTLFPSLPWTKVPGGQPFHSYAGNFDSSRSFTGLGPSLSWKNATPVASGDDRSVTLDWGINAALLFGRQKARTHHQTTKLYHDAHPNPFVSNPATVATIYRSPATPDHSRGKSVIVPNVGGFAGLSFRYDAAKVSLGYRADFFFGAMDGGIDARKTYDRNFYGPFATISVGLGG